MDARSGLLLAAVCAASHCVAPCLGARALAIDAVAALRSNPSEEQASVVKSGQQGTNVTVRAYWMRHGMSCANIIRQFSLIGVITQHTYADPSLTNCAIKHAQGLGKKIRASLDREQQAWSSPLTVFSSVLVRSMETALYNFPSSRVYPIPYIAEHDTFPDNVPLPWYIPDKTEKDYDQRESKLDRAPNTPTLLERLTFDGDVNPADDPERNGEHKTDYNLFKEEFPKMLSLLLPEQYIVPGAIIPVVIVSHSGFMKDSLKCRGKERPFNNEVWVKDYSAELLTRAQLAASASDNILLSLRRAARAPPLRETSERCGQDVIDLSVYPKYRGQRSSGFIKQTRVCAFDVERCSQTNWWMPAEWENTTCCEESDVTWIS